MTPRSGHLPENTLKALFWMSTSAFFFSLMGVCVKSLARGIPEFEIVFFRSLISLLCVWGMMLARKEPLFQGEYRLLTLRGIAGFVGISCLVYSLMHLPLSIAMMLCWSSPLFVILISAAFLGERLPARALALVGAAFMGLLLLLNPRFSSVPLPPLAVAIGLLGALAGGTAYITVRAATARIGVNAIIFFFMLVSLLISAPLAAPGFVVPDSTQWLGLLGVGLSATVAQVAMTHGYRFAKAGIVSTMNLLNAAFAALLGIALFNEHLALIQWAGMALLAAAIGLLAIQKST